MNTEYLLKLADFLDTVPDKSFDIQFWTFTKATKPEGATPGECGFAGCALGWAAHAKLFRGLRLHENDIQYHDLLSYEAAAELFDITYHEAFALFTSSVEMIPHRLRPNRETPKQVARRIRVFVKETISRSHLHS